MIEKIINILDNSYTTQGEFDKHKAAKELLYLYLVMPRLICHYNEREGGYLTVGKVYEAEAINE